MPSALEVALLRKWLPAAGGRITFRDFMDLALYDPDAGYYGSGRARIGARGDFVTSSGLHRLFGALVARWLTARWKELDRPDPFMVYEYGPGTGRLAADILEALSGEPAGGPLRYTLVERSAAMRERQRASLEEYGDRIAWLERAPEPARARAGVVLANELVDALPVHRARVARGRIEEEYVAPRATGQGLVSVWDEPSTPELERYVRRFCGDDLEGIELEINLDALVWLREAAASIERGFLLTIDYGDLAPRLIGPWAPHGTIRAFSRGRVSGGVLERAGERDLTASVNFTALVEEGREAGLDLVTFASQRSFLVELGLLEEIVALSAALDGGRERLRDLLAAKSLLVPGGIGDATRVLVQRVSGASTARGSLLDQITMARDG